MIRNEEWDRRHIQATEHLRNARQYGSEAAQEREERTPELTSEQRQQLQQYLKLMADNEPEIYPNPNKK